MHGLDEIIAMNQADHTKLPVIVRDTLRRLSLWDRRILIGEILLVLGDETPDRKPRWWLGPQKSPSERTKGPEADRMVRGATRRP